MVDCAHDDHLELDTQEEAVTRPEANLTTVLTYVLDRGNLNMRDYNSLQLVSRSMNVVVSQFYPHVQSVARLGLTDRVVARALKSPEIFFRKFPVMNDLHVPWNPPIIDSSAAISITDACQLLTDYPQIRSLPPMYLEREGLEGLGGHSLRSVTFYPGRYDDDGESSTTSSDDDVDGESSTTSSDDLNAAAAKLQVEQLEIVSNCETEEEHIGPSSGIGMENEALMRNLLDNENLKIVRQLIQIEDPEAMVRSHGIVPRPPKFCLDAMLGVMLGDAMIDCMKNITDLSIWFKSINQVQLCLLDRKSKFPSVKAVHFERVCTGKIKWQLKAGQETERGIPTDLSYYFPVGISEEVLRIFPNLEKLTAPRSSMLMDFNPRLISFDSPGRNYNEWIEKMIPIIFSSGIEAVTVSYDNCVKSKNTDMLEEYLRACKPETIKQLAFELRNSHLLAQVPLQRFIEAFPKLEGLRLSGRCPQIGDEIFTMLAKANLRSLKHLMLNGTSCTLIGVRKYIKWRHRQIEVLKMNLSAVHLGVPSGITRFEMQGLYESMEEHVYLGAKIDLYST